MENYCEMPKENASAQEIKEILASARTIAVVGLSNNPDRDSYRVATYLKEQGYKIIPVNPNASEILNEQCYSDLRQIPLSVDIVNIFRKPEAIPAIVDEAIAIGAKAIWMQSGLAHNEAAGKARAAGLKVVMSRCIMVEHRNLPA